MLEIKRTNPYICAVAGTYINTCPVYVNTKKIVHAYLQIMRLVNPSLKIRLYKNLLTFLLFLNYSNKTKNSKNYWWSKTNKYWNWPEKLAMQIFFNRKNHNMFILIHLRLAAQWLRLAPNPQISGILTHCPYFHINIIKHIW